MDINEFIYKKSDSKILTDGSFTWKAPSNIALVKYWGKHKMQQPKNTSISFTLDACHTITTLEFKRHSEFISESHPQNNELKSSSAITSIEVFLDNVRKPEFQ